ncbi:MAG: sulfatase [Verrucomicrobiota bacterium]|jgi:arylsulfatase A-like enzyme|nr:sulfatase [Verrucomicrobiota bacterium]
MKLALTLFLAATSLMAAEPAARDTRPNFLFLLTDDQRADDLGCYGNTVIQTPHIDSLAQRGVRFTRFFVTSSICMASRASYFTGRVERSHACNFYYRSLAAKDWAQSYPVLLRQAGYRTGFIGKFGVAVAGLPQGLPRGNFDSFEGFAGQGDYFPQGKNGPHLERLMGDQALRFLHGAAEDGKPFCLSVSFKAPHDPLTPEPAFAGLYVDAKPPRTESWPFTELSGLPPVFGTSAWYARLSWQQHCSTEEKLHEFIRQRYRLIAGVDAALGHILAELQKLGLAENTVILFSSDNGYYYGEHGLNTKFYLHEESIRVPLLVMDPRLPQRAGTTVDALTANMDVAPTLLDLAGIKASDAMQGRSLLPLLRGETPADWRDAILCENLVKERRPMCDAIRTRDWKYIAYFETQPLQEELYHLAEDPREQRNLAALPEHQAVKQTLVLRLQKMRVDFSGAPDGSPAWIQTQKENTANWQGYRNAYQRLKRP